MCTQTHTHTHTHTHRVLPLLTALSVRLQVLKERETDMKMRDGKGGRMMTSKQTDQAFVFLCVWMDFFVCVCVCVRRPRWDANKSVTPDMTLQHHNAWWKLQTPARSSCVHHQVKVQFCVRDVKFNLIPRLLKSRVWIVDRLSQVIRSYWVHLWCSPSAGCNQWAGRFYQRAAVHVLSLTFASRESPPSVGSLCFLFETFLLASFHTFSFPPLSSDAHFTFGFWLQVLLSGLLCFIPTPTFKMQRDQFSLIPPFFFMICAVISQPAVSVLQVLLSGHYVKVTHVLCDNYLLNPAPCCPFLKMPCWATSPDL